MLRLPGSDAPEANPLRAIAIPIEALQRAVDALCRAHHACEHLDCVRTILAGEVEIVESPFTKTLKAAKDEMRKMLEDAGIAW